MLHSKFNLPPREGGFYTKEFMKIKMKYTRYGSADGMRVDEYKKGETYDVRESLARIFLKEGWAVQHVPKDKRRWSCSGKQNCEE